VTSADRKLVWFGLLGAPLAWTVQHVTGFGLTQAACRRTGIDPGVQVDGTTLITTGLAALIAIAAGVTALMIFRRVDAEPSGPPPGSRVKFLAILGMTIAPLFLAIILMSGIASAVLPDCRQS
jgi:hypothetical protein